MAGGVAFLEVTRNPTTGQWHPHLHLILEGSFLPQSQLSARWHEITGDSYVVHVRIVRDSARDAHYVAKYLGNPFESAVYRDPLALDQAMRAITGRRCMMTFGSWRSRQLNAPPTPRVWQVVGSLELILQAARAGHQRALAIVHRLQRSIAWNPPPPSEPMHPRPAAPSPTESSSPQRPTVPTAA